MTQGVSRVNFADDFKVSIPVRPHVWSLPSFKSYLVQAAYMKLARLSQVLRREESPSVKATAVKVITDTHVCLQGR